MIPFLGDSFRRTPKDPHINRPGGGGNRQSATIHCKGPRRPPDRPTTRTLSDFLGNGHSRWVVGICAFDAASRNGLRAFRTGPGFTNRPWRPPNNFCRSKKDSDP